MNIIHKISNRNLPRVRHLGLNTQNTGGGRIFTARPRRSAGLDNRHPIQDLLRFPKLVLWGHMRYHPAINIGRKAGELRMTARHEGAGQRLIRGPVRRNRRHNLKGWYEGVPAQERF